MPDFLAEALTWPHNYHYALALEAAMTWKVPPLTILTDAQPTDGWTIYDRKLSVAWVIMNREECSQCHQPLWICRSNNSMLAFSIRKGTCYASAALEKWNDKNSKKLKAGEYPYIVPEMMNGENLPGRQEYFTQED